MKVVKTVDAVGMMIGHDITEIVPGKFKGVAFKKGHIIKNQDIDHLLRIGKEHMYVIEVSEYELHEDEAAREFIKHLPEKALAFSEPSEGKIDIYSNESGLLLINKQLVEAINTLGAICFATIQGNRHIDKNKLLAGFRVIPLLYPKSEMEKLNSLLFESDFVVDIVKYTVANVHIIVTGSEIFSGKIDDRFGPVVQDKISKLVDCKFTKVIVNDNTEAIEKAICEAKSNGADFIIVTGGMSVDPDDKTPGAIKSVCSEIIAYGAPVLPGSMFMLAYMDAIPVVGLPGCVMYSKTTVFDILLPRILASVKISPKDIFSLGYGGLCLKCDQCVYPDCHFGKN